MRIVLRDNDLKGERVAMITTETSTAKEVQNAIYRVKKTYENYDSDDLEAGLPDDCIIEWFDNDSDTEVWW